jgi:two-component system, sensor histidine kinase and response regulator
LLTRRVRVIGSHTLIYMARALDSASNLPARPLLASQPPVRTAPNKYSQSRTAPAMEQTSDLQELPQANILLVDDEPASLLALEVILGDLGQNLVKATSGEAALRCLLETDFAMILLDIKMEGLDGFQTAELIRARKRSRHTPIIFLTAYDLGNFPVAQAYSLGAVDYLMKPLIPEIIRAKVGFFVELFQKSEELRRTAEELRRSNRELEQFAYVASHDLKEPLRIMTIYIQLLERAFRGKLDDKTSQYIRHAAGAAERMKRLINDLLAYARVGSSTNHLAGEVDCAAAFDQAVANLAAVIGESRAQISRGALPTLRGDPTQLVQLFQNLIANSVTYCKDAAPIVRAEAIRQSRHWLFSVHDNGIGIDPEHAERIFLIFERLHHKSESSGTGIGLAICKKIVERHGGSIWVESKPGQGSTFLFTLPAQERTVS